MSILSGGDLLGWFNFEDKEAIARGWHGGIQEGFRFENVYPEFKLQNLD